MTAPIAASSKLHYPIARGKFSFQMPTRLKPLWRCPKCRERFVTANIWHSCGKYRLEALFNRSEPQVLEYFREFEQMVRKCGPVRMIPQKTRVVFQVRVRFASCYPRRSYLLCSVALPRTITNPRFVKIEKFAAHFIGHHFHISSKEGLDAEVQDWLFESYAVGAQEHLKK